MKLPESKSFAGHTKSWLFSLSGPSSCPAQAQLGLLYSLAVFKGTAVL